MRRAHSLTPPSRDPRAACSSSSVSWRRSSSTFSWKPGSAVTSSERGRGASTSVIERIRPGPGREQHDAVGQEHGLGDRVGDEHDGRLRGLGDPLQLEVHLVARHRVERAERLVHEQDLGVVAQGPGDGDALAHAAGELARAAPSRSPAGRRARRARGRAAGARPCRPCAAAAAGRCSPRPCTRGRGWRPGRRGRACAARRRRGGRRARAGGRRSSPRRRRLGQARRGSAASSSCRSPTGRAA